MCGRYASFLPAEAVARLFHTVNPIPNVAASWNVAPRQDAMVIRRHPETGQRHLDLLNWGLLPGWVKDPKPQRPINARAETVASSGLFRGAFNARRCIVPADAFYEWQAVEGGKQPYAISRVDGQPLAFAGLWEACRVADGSILRSYVILTTRANDDIRDLHQRMPVVLEAADFPIWLGEIDADPATVLHPAANRTLHAWPVSRAVNTPRNNGPELLDLTEPTLPGDAAAG